MLRLKNHVKSRWGNPLNYPTILLRPVFDTSPRFFLFDLGARNGGRRPPFIYHHPGSTGGRTVELFCLGFLLPRETRTKPLIWLPIQVPAHIFLHCPAQLRQNTMEISIGPPICIFEGACRRSSLLRDPALAASPGPCRSGASTNRPEGSQFPQLAARLLTREDTIPRVC